MKTTFFLSLVLAFSFANIKAQNLGCTDPLASNYNASATQNDGSCTYTAATISPIITQSLNILLKETSGLIKFGNSLYSHNDDTDKSIYAMDTITGAITQTYSLSTLVNIDWEEISQDSLFVYLGDVGNNVNGNRTNLRIYKISKSSLLANAPIIDTIKFSYSNQTNFAPTGNNNTDFDCEAFIVNSDSIFLFTKQWLGSGTAVYSLPKIAGTHTANLKGSLNVQGLITGATVLPGKKLIALSGYSTLLQPFIYLLYDYNGNSFFSGNKRKFNLSLSFHQVEAIATTNGIKYYITNESYINTPFVNNPQKLHILDFSAYLSNYINTPIITSASNFKADNQTLIYPTPSSGIINVELSQAKIGENYKLIDCVGKVVLEGIIMSKKEEISLNNLNKGIYFLFVGDNPRRKIILN